ncbi:helix-turn-helix domain-containing protein [Methyloceanibacter caenitepidi]|uniref:helix-turn-helix domain-containing protein n=1 Tax=Methyloceanibacter caenitepidi TaxID=1384459 RepID=UPI0009E44681
MKAITNRQTLTIVEAGEALGIGRSAAYEAARSGELPTIRIGHRLLVPVLALESLLRSCLSPRGALHDQDPQN